MNANTEMEIAFTTANWAQTVIDSPHTKAEDRAKLIEIRDTLRNGMATPDQWNWIQEKFFT